MHPFAPYLLPRFRFLSLLRRSDRSGCQYAGTRACHNSGMARRKQFDWAAMQAAIDSGAGFIRCREMFGIAHATWMRALECGDIQVDQTGKPYSDARNRYDWVAIQKYYDEGNSFGQCRERFGFCSAAWVKAVRRGELRTRPRSLPIEEILRNSVSRTTIKRRLIQAGILINECDECGLSEWRNKPLSIQIDHRNGVRNDHRLENLRMLCPNCHSQTETFAARNLRRSRVV